MSARFAVALLIFAAACCGLLTAQAEEPLHKRLDKIITGAAGGPVAPPAADGEFLRRLYLDLAGRIPTTAEARAFLADASPTKRAAAVDRVLASEDHVRRMSQFLHVMLMERLGDHEDWRKFLTASVKENKPWDALVREMLNPDSSNEQTRGSALFFSKRLENYGQNPVDVPGMVRDVGRMFLGIDVQCAQCHDHLFVDEYKQEHYHGLFAYVSQVSLKQGEKFPAIIEKPLTKKLDFMSVFVQEPKTIGPKLPGLEEVSLPTFGKGEEYEIPPDPKTKFPGKPKLSLLKALSEQLPSQQNTLFSRNIANRLWWLLLGRGQVHPLDLMHADNPASHPAALDLLSSELVAHQFDLRYLLKEIALSETYQRSSAADFALDSVPPQSYRVAIEKPLLSEQLLGAMLVATGMEQTAAKDAKAREELQLKFDKAFAAPAREPEVEHAPTVKAALFLLNESTVLGWLNPQEGNLVDRLQKLAEPADLAEELYLSVLTRKPTAEETALVTEYLAKHASDRPAAISRLAWSLLASNEFCINH